MLFTKIPANKLGTLCAIFYWCEKDMRKFQLILKFKSLSYCCGIFLCEIQLPPLSEFLLVSSARNSDRESYKEIP